MLLRSLLLSTTLVATIAGTGCLDQDLDLGTLETLSYEQYRALVPRDPATGGFVLDWDIVVYDEASIHAAWAESQTAGALLLDTKNGQDVRWSDTEKRALTYCISRDFGAHYSEVVAAMHEASVNGWELFGDVKFPYQSQLDASCHAGNPAVKFVVAPTDSGEYLAHSFFPDAPIAQRVLSIDETAFGRQDLLLPNILTHELGHILGFRHEHIARPGQNIAGCVEDTNYRPIGDGYDELSTMHYPQCGAALDKLALSVKDKAGIVAVYGRAGGTGNVPPMTKVNYPPEHASLAQEFTVQAAAVDDDLVKVQLRIDGRVIQEKTVGPFVFDVPAQKLGAHVMEIVATDASGQESVKRIEVTVDRTGSDVGRPLVGGCDAGGAGGDVGLLGGLLAAAGVLRRRRRPSR